MTKKRSSIVYQFRIELLEIEPTIWRTIQVPSEYSFWDLHVAIQDAMGWLDYHLHAFHVRMPHRRRDTEIGIPDDEDFDHAVLPGWQVPITEYFTEPGKSAIYDYDFGDGWSHRVLLEAMLLKEDRAKYPRCIAGERACPPEDCGGVHGYYELLEILGNTDHAEYEEYIEWLKGYAKNDDPYDPGKFNPDEVKFWDPKKRWKMAFSE
ncbi:MAG: Plasmid pRiA4b ORF-3-like protein [Syntrophus sp. PtaB.Bin075]|nr:MAG: Plasmid pRiA4b ORF-3-like protein [Syntrophus sp. PtaB.Bin075]